MTGSIAFLCLLVPLAVQPIGEGPTGPSDPAIGDQCGAGARLPVVRLEQWEENALFGGALEGFHAWTASEAHGALRERGLGATRAGVIVLAAGLGVELAEVAVGDAQGVSVQDLVADCLGIGAALAGLTVRYQYVACLDAPARYEGLAQIPLMPVNGHTNAFEFAPSEEGPCVGLKYVGEPADVAVGFTSMSVLPRESGAGVRTPYVGYVFSEGVSVALGIAGDPGGARTLELGAGYRLESDHVGIVFQVLLADARHGWGVAVYPR